LGGKNIKRGTAKEKGRKRIEMGETDVKKDEINANGAKIGSKRGV
jgi:hypothetical protein